MIKFFLKALWFLLIIVSCLVGLVCLIFGLTNVIMYASSRNEAPPLTPKGYAIVLGASVHGDALSGALRARMEAALFLYHKKLVKHIFMSGDGTDVYYSETSAMKKFALKNGISEDILVTDEKGYNTYATILRAKKVFNIQSAYIISQNFHLTRAVWIARKVGIEADGFGAGKMQNEWYYSLREFFARTKDFFQVIFTVKPYDDKSFLF